MKSTGLTDWSRVFSRVSLQSRRLSSIVPTEFRAGPGASGWAKYHCQRSNLYSELFSRSTLPSSSINWISSPLTLQKEQTLPLHVGAVATLLMARLRRRIMFGQSATRRFSRFSGRTRSEGAGLVACASAAPLAILALAVAVDYAKVSHFRSRVQFAAGSASVAAAEAIARQPGIANGGDIIAGRVAEFCLQRSGSAWGWRPYSRGNKPRGRSDGHCWICRRGAEQFRLRVGL